MELFDDFPSMGRTDLRDLKKGIDFAFRDFSRENGEAIEGFFDPLMYFMVWFEKLLIEAPWPLMILIFAVSSVAWRSQYSHRHWHYSIVFCYWLVWHVGRYYGHCGHYFCGHFFVYWLGIPLGILMSRSNRLQAVVTPVLDVMQTIPSFVYLIPVVMLLGIGKVPGLIAVCIYALPPIVRLTNLGIRLVDKDVLEAAAAFGSSYRQKLFDVQMPLALPNIFAGVNQTIMMALAMVVIASMIGVKGLGVPVLRAVSNQYLALGLMNGLAIVALAVIFDRVSQAVR